MTEKLQTWNNLYPFRVFPHLKVAPKFKYWKTGHAAKIDFKVCEESYKKPVCVQKAGTFKFNEHLMF